MFFIPVYNETVTKKELLAALHDLPISEIRWHESIPSTSTSALEWLRESPPEYALVAADRQTAGYGRNQRPWYSNQGASLTFSFIIYPNHAEQKVLSLFSALTALALCRAVSSYSPTVELSMKWPNDVLIEKKKAAGILAEAAWEGNLLKGLVIGIGVNVGLSSLSQTSPLLFPAISLEEALGKKIDGLQLLHDFFQNFISLRPHIPSQEFIELWQKRLAFLGETVSISGMGKETRNGIFLGVNKQGHLLLKEKSGRISTFPMGDMSLRPQEYP